MKNILYILFFLCAYSFSQEIKVSGFIKDSIGTSLESANVIALVKTTNKLASYSVTNSNGKYQLFLEANNSYVLNVSYIGFKTVSFDLNVQESQNEISKDFVMYDDDTQLGEVILSYQMPIVVKNDTIRYNTDSFTNGTEKKLGDVLKKLPGVEINADGQIEVEGKQVTKVMVEGKDFFDGDSKLAVENIPSDAIEKIEVLKNYSEVEQLSAVTNNEDNIAINLKLKEGKKSFWFGEVTAGGGLDERYLVHPKLFYYSPKKSVSVITDFNNIGELPFTRRDYYNFTGGFRKASTGSGTSLNLSTDNLGLSQLKDNKANDILTKFAAANFGYAVSDTWDLSGFLIYSGTEVDLLERTTTNYFNDDLVEQTEQTTQQNNNLGLVKFSSLYKPNKNFQFDYDVFLKISKQEESDNLTSSFSDVTNTINTNKNDDPYSLQQNANIYYTLNDKNVFSSEVQYLLSQENPFYNATFLDLGENPSGEELPFSTIFPYDFDQQNYSLNQDKTIKTNRLDAKVDYYYLFNNNSNLNVTLGSVFSKQTFDSSIFQTLDDGSVNDFTNSELNNDNVSYNFTDVFLDLEYKFSTGKFTFTPGLSLHNYTVKNSQLGNTLSSNETMLLPSLYANLKLQTSENLQFTYSTTAEFADINKIAEGYVFNNYNSLFQGNKTIDNGLYENYRLNYSSFSLFNYTNVNASINYLKKKDDVKNNVLFDQINRVSVPVNSQLTDESLTINGRFGKTFGKYKVNLKANVGFSKYYNIVNDDLDQSKSFTQNYTASVLTNFKNWPNFEVGYEHIINEYTNENSENTYVTNRPFANIEALILKDFAFRSEYSFYNYADQDQSLNTYSFLDANLSYQKDGSKWEYTLGMTNILNTSSINQDNFNQNYSSTSQYFVQPRYGVFSVKYNL